MPKKNWWLVDANEASLSPPPRPEGIPELTLEAADAMLKKLSDFFKEPVMPIKRYCEVLGDWLHMMDKKDWEDHEHRGDAYDRTRYDHVLISIHKSNYLYRRLYEGEEKRTRPCPIHKGKWAGIAHCTEGCGSVGWLPNDLPPRARRTSNEKSASGRAWTARCHFCYAGIFTTSEEFADAFMVKHGASCVRVPDDTPPPTDI